MQDVAHIIMTFDVVMNFQWTDSFLKAMKSIDLEVLSKTFMAGIQTWLQSIRGQLKTCWMVRSL